VVHTQQGSPSSRPLDLPSPSESASHKALVQLRPADANAEPKAFLPPPPEQLDGDVHELCPTPPMLPFGILLL
jgi:hypothetical protein